MSRGNTLKPGTQGAPGTDKAAADKAAADKAAADKAAADKAAADKAATAGGDTIIVDGKIVKLKFGGHIPDMGKTYTKDELLADAEAVAYLLEIGSGCVQIVEPSKID